MENRPPALVEAVVGRLIPPDSREHVLGDLHESCTSLARYLVSAAAIVPRLLLCRIGRLVKADFGLYCAEIALLATAFASPRALVSGAWSQIPAAVVFVALLVRDAYVDVSARPDTVAGRADAFEAALAASARDLLLAIAAAWIVHYAAVPSAHQMSQGALFDLSGFCFLMFGAMRAAWWTLYVPATRLSRFGRSVPDASLNEQELQERRRARRRRQVAWRAMSFMIIGAGVTPLIFGAPAVHPAARIVFDVFAIVAIGDLSTRANRIAKDECGGA